MGGGAPASETQQQQQSWTNLNSLFNTAQGAAKAFQGSGTAALDDVAKYFKNLLSGNRQDTAAAVAPAINAANAGNDAARQERASEGTARTGGNVAAEQQSQDRVRSAIDTLIGGAKPAAATSLQTLGEADINAMMSALGLGTTATGTVGAQTSSDINSRRQAAADMWGSLLGGGSSILGAWIGRPR